MEGEKKARDDGTTREKGGEVGERGKEERRGGGGRNVGAV